MGLKDSIKEIKGIGPKKAESLTRLGIRTIEDLLYFFPRDYEDRRELRKIAFLMDGQTALVKARVVLKVKGKYNYNKKQPLKLLVEDDSGSLEIIFFQAAYLEKTFEQGGEYEFYGKAEVQGERRKMVHPDFSKWEKGSQQKIWPIYPLTAGIGQPELRKWVTSAEQYCSELTEYLPEDILQRNRLCGIEYAIKNIHFPGDDQKIKIAKFRLIFEELLFLQLGLLSIKGRMKEDKIGICFSREVRMEEFAKLLPYKLTDAQLRVLDEISIDMESNQVMNRLVQGDVGSGKTAVAAAALFKAVRSGYQGVMMAPTELLARQHYDTLREQFESCGIRVGFLSSSVTAKERRLILEMLEAGELDLLVGTHAVIQPDVHFSKLGLVITDEQHRFGVNQRALLSQKGENPDILVMTATPIPRTLAMILYGDLDISIIDEMPPGRQTIITRTVAKDGRDAAYEFIRREVKNGSQAYIVAPLIEESETLDAKSAMGVYEELVEKFQGDQVALLYGGMKQREKDEIMERFHLGEIDILVSTVVIEVGINVPNATVMLIENAERFGLAQLHQLRGRVGRGKKQSYCILITEGKTEVAKQRAEIMKQTNDGFLIAEKDLELRGPGEFFGMRQHGVPELKLADLVKHVKILKLVKEEAENFLRNDPFLFAYDHEGMRMQIDKMFENVENISI